MYFQRANVRRALERSFGKSSFDCFVAHPRGSQVLLGLNNEVLLGLYEVLLGLLKLYLEEDPEAAGRLIWDTRVADVRPRARGIRADAWFLCVCVSCVSCRFVFSFCRARARSFLSPLRAFSFIHS